MQIFSAAYPFSGRLIACCVKFSFHCMPRLAYDHSNASLYMHVNYEHLAAGKEAHRYELLPDFSVLKIFIP